MIVFIYIVSLSLSYKIFIIYTIASLFISSDFLFAIYILLT